MQTLQTGKHPIHIGNDTLEALDAYLGQTPHSRLVVLADENTSAKCLPAVKKGFTVSRSLTLIKIKSGEKNKNLRSCEKIWKELTRLNADRKTLFINLGGGVICDLGGFAASTYKRGLRFVNVPTTLLAQVDASVGGKTGIDFAGYKNQIGTFAFPEAVFVNPAFLKTLPKRELLSGFAEIIKHGLIADKAYWKQIQNTSPAEAEHLIAHSIEIKNHIVTQDPYESGIRKVLNFGHTIGHALESASLNSKKRLLHGEAIAIGIVCEAYLSRKCCGLSGEDLDAITRLIQSVYQPASIKLPAKKLIALMKQDKKNKDSEINFTLLSGIGKAVTDNTCADDLIEESILYFNSNCK